MHPPQQPEWLDSCVDHIVRSKQRGPEEFVAEPEQPNVKNKLIQVNQAEPIAKDPESRETMMRVDL